MTKKEYLEIRIMEMGALIDECERQRTSPQTLHPLRAQHKSLVTMLKAIERSEQCQKCYCETCGRSTGDIHTHGPLGVDFIDKCDECQGGPDGAAKTG
jgi:hypothetical protein